jgi:hypothetical protein
MSATPEQHQADEAGPVLWPSDTTRRWHSDLDAVHRQLVELICLGSAEDFQAYRRARALSTQIRRQLEIGAPFQAEKTLRLLEREVIDQRQALGGRASDGPSDREAAA